MQLHTPTLWRFIVDKNRSTAIVPISEFVIEFLQSILLHYRVFVIKFLQSSFCNWVFQSSFCKSIIYIVLVEFLRSTLLLNQFFGNRFCFVIEFCLHIQALRIQNMVLAWVWRAAWTRDRSLNKWRSWLKVLMYWTRWSVSTEQRAAGEQRTTGMVSDAIPALY